MGDFFFQPAAVTYGYEKMSTTVSEMHESVNHALEKIKELTSAHWTGGASQSFTQLVSAWEEGVNKVIHATDSDLETVSEFIRQAPKEDVSNKTNITAAMNTITDTASPAGTAGTAEVRW